MSLDFFFRIKKCPWPVGFGIILELKCISRHKSFGRAYKTGQSIFIVFYKSCVHCIRSVACHYKQDRNGVSFAAGIFNIVREILKNQPFIQSTERSSHFRKIIWRTDDKPVCFPDCVQNRSKTVPADTEPLKSSNAFATDKLFIRCKQRISFLLATKLRFSFFFLQRLEAERYWGHGGKLVIRHFRIVRMKVFFMFYCTFEFFKIFKTNIIIFVFMLIIISC